MVISMRSMHKTQLHPYQQQNRPYQHGQPTTYQGLLAMAAPVWQPQPGHPMAMKPQMNVAAVSVQAQPFAGGMHMMQQQQQMSNSPGVCVPGNMGMNQGAFV